MSDLNLEALQFTSNTIELKPDKKYLLIFKGINHYQLNQINDALRRRGFDCLCIIAPQDQDIQVIEAPVPEPDPLWTQLSRGMTTNERRELIAKLAEKLGLATCLKEEEGPTVGTKQFTQEEINEMLEPYREIE